jgi:hypothetical protein
MHVHRDAAVRTRSTVQRPESRSGPVTVLTPDPAVWATARTIAASQPGSKIRVIHKRKVEITY